MPMSGTLRTLAILLATACALILAMCVLTRPLGAENTATTADVQSNSTSESPGATTKTSKQRRALATFASGCFWCTESDFDKVPGVLKTISGYIGGRTKNPTYRQVSTGRTGHTEAVQVTYDPSKVTYERLLDHYWRNVDLLDGKGQFCDRGSQYRPAIFTHTPQQKRLAKKSKAALQKSGRFSKQIAVKIHDATKFTPAETHHQNYYKKNPLKYRYYRYGCGRDRRLRELWGKKKVTTLGFPFGASH